MSVGRRVIQEGSIVEGTVELFTTGISFFTHQLSLVFYNNEQMLPEHEVRKSDMSGSVVFEASETGVEYGQLQNSPITLGSDDYARPIVTGSYASFNMTLYNVQTNIAIAPATHFKVLMAGASGIVGGIRPLIGLMRQVFSPNGTTQFLELGRHRLGVGYEVEFDFIAPTSAEPFAILTDGHDELGTRLLTFIDTGKLNYSNSTCTLDGAATVSNVTDFPTDGEVHKLVLTTTTISDLSLFGARATTEAGKSTIPIYNIKVRDSLGNTYIDVPANDGWAKNPTLANISNLGTDTRRQAPNPNGISQYINLPTINLVVGDTVTFTFIAPKTTLSSLSLLLQSEVDNQFEVYSSNSGILRIIGCTATLDGSAIVDGVTLVPTDGLPHTVVTTITAATATLYRLGASSTAGSLSTIAIYDVTINDGSVYNYPIDDDFANNPVIRNVADLSGLTDGTAINFTAATWSEIGTNVDGLGSEAVVNGGFNTNLDAWSDTSGAWSWEDGRAKLTNGDSAGKNIRQVGVLTLGVTYIIEFDIEVDTGSLILQNQAGQAISGGATGHYKLVWTADTTSLIFKRGQNIGIGYLDNVSAHRAEGFGKTIDAEEGSWTLKDVS